MAASAFALRRGAAESQFMAGEERLWVVKRLERLVQEGKVDASLLERAQASESTASSIAHTPTDAIRGKATVFQYERGVTALPSRAVASSSRYALGMQVSFGRQRWNSDGASIFSVADGKRLAQTPPPLASTYENIRYEKMQRAALESPQLRGLRVLPAMTPGRAMLWGSILAAWGTAAIVASAARALDITSTADASPKLRAAMHPLTQSLKASLAPLKASLAIGTSDAPGAALRDGSESGASLAAKFRAVLI